MSNELKKNKIQTIDKTKEPIQRLKEAAIDGN